MGISTVTAARILEGQRAGRQRRGEPARLRNPAVPRALEDLQRDQQTSDSAPTMTAMMTGVKTRKARWPSTNRRAGEKDAAVDRAARRTHPGTGRGARPVDRHRHDPASPTPRPPPTTPTPPIATGRRREPARRARASADIAAQLVATQRQDGIEVVLGGGRAPFLPANGHRSRIPGAQGPPQGRRDPDRRVGRRSARRSTSGTARSLPRSTRRPRDTCSGCSNRRTCSTKPTGATRRRAFARRDDGQGDRHPAQEPQGLLT